MTSNAIENEDFSQKRNKGSENNFDTSSKNLNNQKEAQTIEMKFNNILVQADQLMAKEDYPGVVAKLNLLFEKINVLIITFYRNQFLKLNQKQYDVKIQLVCLYNLAVAYHKQWILDKCINLVDKFVKMLKSTMQQEEGKQGKSSYWFKMKHLLVKMQLQYCAILSQVGEHSKALEIAIEVSKSLKELFQKGYYQVNKLLDKISKIDSKKSIQNPFDSKTPINHQHIISNDKVEFAATLLTQAKQTLTELLKIQTYEEITKQQNFEKVRQELFELKSRTYFWKDNPQNNIKLLRKQLSQKYHKKSFHNMTTKQPQTQGRSLLGIKRSQSWIQQITIAHIMLMSPLNYLEFSEKDNIIFQFNYKNILEKIILVSVTYFSLAIELRFIETEERMGKEMKEKGQALMDKEKKLERKQTAQSPQEMKKSQVFHLKSIVLLCKLIKENSAFLNHLVINYHKHYKQDLVTIDEESSMAQFSYIYDKRTKTSSFPVLPDKTDEEKKDVAKSPKSPRRSYFEDRQANGIRKKKFNCLDQKFNSVYVIKKSSKQDLDIFKERPKCYQQSISASKNQTGSQRSIKSFHSGYHKSIIQKQACQDITMKKISSGKIVTITSPQKIGFLADRLRNESSEREIQSFKCQKKKSSTLIMESLSLGKGNMNSTTLKLEKMREGKSTQKKKVTLEDLKESTEFKKVDFKKTEKQIQSQKNQINARNKKKEIPKNDLKTLRQSKSNPNFLQRAKAQNFEFQQGGASIKQKSRKSSSGGNMTKR